MAPSKKPPHPVSTVEMGEGSSALHVKSFFVQVIDGPDSGRTAVFDGEELSIGTSPANELVLTDPSVSRHHLTLTSGGEGVCLRDLESKNGTFVGSIRVQAASLEQLPVTMRVGGTTIRVERGEKELEIPLFDDIHWSHVIGKSSAMRQLFALLLKIARTDSTVLLEGETGTGKGLVAHSIHVESPRKSGPFVELDCASIPASLIESELFGHEAGAFTGATSARQGVFEQAKGGTVFLDEIGELPLQLQPKLLRALEDRRVRRVGGAETISLDVRVIAATNVDLRQAVNRGAFRSDLFFRLDIMRLRLPPLRERREDIPVLVSHFYEQLSEGREHPPKSLVEELSLHDWPGNVRELRNAVERAVVTGDPATWRGIDSSRDEGSLSSGPITTPSSGSGEPLFSPDVSFRDAKNVTVARWERAYLEELLAANAGSVVRAARAAKMDRNHLRELARRHGLERENG